MKKNWMSMIWNLIIGSQILLIKICKFWYNARRRHLFNWSLDSNSRGGKNTFRYRLLKIKILFEYVFMRKEWIMINKTITF
jgi:hypothetical protein